MRKVVGIVLCIVIIAAGAAYFYWQNNKKGIVKNLIQHTITDKTDSLYYLRYDSSMIDEINGNVYFRNVYLQSDSDQAAMLKRTDSLPNILINIFISSVEATGIDMPAYLNDKVVHAKKISITNPRIQITNTGAGKLKMEDTLAIYKKIVGEFKSIRADEIIIRGALFINKNRSGEVNTRVSNANVVLTRFKVDSTRDYSNILSYFIDNIVADVDSIYFKGNRNDGKVFLSRINYNTTNKSLDIGKVESYGRGENTPLMRLNQIVCSDLNIKAFVQQHRLQAGKISCAGGIVTVYTAKKDQSTANIKNKSFEFPEEFFDEVEIGSLQLGKTDLMIRDKTDASRPPLHVSNVKFSVTNEINVVEGNTVRNIIDKAKWKLSADGFSIVTEDKIYNISLNGIAIDNNTKSASISRFSVKPRISESEFVRQSGKQGDYYNIDISNIRLSGIAINKFFNESIIDIQQAAVNLNLKVFNDRMLPMNNDSKVGKYPHQLLRKVNTPVYIHHLIIENSSISYRERAMATQQIGNLFFTKVKGRIDNVTNIPAYIRQNPVMTLNGSGLFLGKGTANTEWKLRLDSERGDFSMTGHLGSMDASVFNSISVPLALTSVKGKINDVKFAMNGNDYNAQGKLTMLYNDLKIESYKMDEKGDSLKSNKIENIFSNALIKNNNPAKGVVRSADFAHQRDLNKSFFNLVWKSLFDGIGKTVMGKGALELQKGLNKLKTKQKPK